MPESRGDRIKRNFEQLQSVISNIMSETQEELSERRDVMVKQQVRIETLEAQLHKAVSKLVDIREAMRLEPEGPGVVMSAEVLKAYHRVQDILAK